MTVPWQYGEGEAKGDRMKRVRELGRPAWIFLVGLTFLGWAATGTAAGKSVEPPPGLGAVQPPTPMPKFTLPVVNGEPFDSSTLQGKVVVVRFWATW
jgi:cytochrome oxidase Cu insertion factor (SCO1/SenC/PrrC family)